MGIREVRRAQCIEKIAAHLLREGLAGASLRPMAEAAGISDRMLLYYFTDRNEVLVEVLQAIAVRLAVMLEAGERGKQRPEAFLVWICAAMRSEEMRPYMKLWLDLAAGAGRGEAPYVEIAEAIGKMFLEWAEVQLDVANKKKRAKVAAFLFTYVEGTMVLDAAGMGERVDVGFAARLLAGIA